MVTVYVSEAILILTITNWFRLLFGATNSPRKNFFSNSCLLMCLVAQRQFYAREPTVVHTKLPGIPMTAESRAELFDVDEAVETWEAAQQVGSLIIVHCNNCALQ